MENCDAMLGSLIYQINEFGYQLIFFWMFLFFSLVLHRQANNHNYCEKMCTIFFIIFLCSSLFDFLELFFQMANLTREITRQENAIMKLISLVKPELQRFPVQTQVSVFL